MRCIDELKTYLHELKLDYEAKYKIPFLKDYDKSVPYFEQLEQFLLVRQSEDKGYVDIICLLASVRMELRYDDSHTIGLLEKFMDDNKSILSDIDKVRIYTNIAFYYDYCEEAIDYLKKAEELKSPYIETYKGLGLLYFNDYQLDKDKRCLRKSLKYFKIAAERFGAYAETFGYAVSLYELAEYKEAKVVFETLLIHNPERMRLLLVLAYCEIYLGNKESAHNYLGRVKAGRDDNYDLNTDDIGDFEVMDAYYVLDDYDTFLEEAENVAVSYYTADWAHYFYTLWIKGKKERFEELKEKYILEFEESIEDAGSSKDYESEDERREDIESYEESKKNFELMIERIEKGDEKPGIKLSLYPEFGCFLIDCIRHKYLDKI